MNRISQLISSRISSDSNVSGDSNNLNEADIAVSAIILALALGLFVADKLANPLPVPTTTTAIATALEGV